MQTAQGNLDNAYQVALQAQVTVGTQQAQITTLNSSGSNYGEQLKEQISKLQSVDYTTAISQFSAAGVVAGRAEDVHGNAGHVAVPVHQSVICRGQTVGGAAYHVG